MQDAFQLKMFIFQVKNRCLRTGDKSHAVYGKPEEAPGIKTFLDIWKHPFNPTYTSVQTPQIKSLPSKGYALVEEELASRELDEDILSKENAILEIIGKVDENDNQQDANNNETTLNKRRSKNTLNMELPPSSQCGLAITTVAYKND